MSIFLASSPLDFQPIVDRPLTGIGSACLAAISVFGALYGLGIIMKSWAETTGVNTGPKYDYADD